MIAPDIAVPMAPPILAVVSFMPEAALHSAEPTTKKRKPMM
jgi:hypothetical protein